MKPSLYSLALLASMAAPGAIRAASCAPTTLDVYITAGFTCQAGTLLASGFSWSSDAIGLAQDHVNLPVNILVTPQSGPSGISFSVIAKTLVKTENVTAWHPIRMAMIAYSSV